MQVEPEHGEADPSSNVTGGYSMLTGKIAWDHLDEVPDYYSGAEENGKFIENYKRARWASIPRLPALFM
ncbi:MAG: DUF5661 family protein [Nitrososphaera sp.]